MGRNNGVGSFYEVGNPDQLNRPVQVKVFIRFHFRILGQREVVTMINTFLSPTTIHFLSCGYCAQNMLKNLLSRAEGKIEKGISSDYLLFRFFKIFCLGGQKIDNGCGPLRNDIGITAGS